jgi:AcrR family transcriptional regulator
LGVICGDVEPAGVMNNRAVARLTKTRGEPRVIPRRTAGRNIVDAILQSAVDVLSRDGFQRLTTNRIARFAGVSIGSVYQYFPDKHAIIAAIGRELEQKALRLFRTAIAESSARPIADVSREIVAGLSHESFGKQAVRRAILKQVPRAWLEEASQRVDAAVTAELAKLLTSRTDVRAGDPELMAFVVVHAVEAVLEAAVLRRPELLTDEAFVNEVTALSVNYLQRSRSEGENRA